MEVKYSYWTKTRGVGGAIKVPEDFVVTEILEKKFLRSFDHRNARRARSYNLIYFMKRSMTTREAIRRLGVHAGFAGLKDKFSVSYQYATSRDIPKETENPRIAWIRKTDYWLSPGSLRGNEFCITLHGADEPDVRELVQRGMPNYFGPQRFSRENHEIGKLLVQRAYGQALERINASYRKQCSLIEQVPKWKLKFFVNAYQSWLFNEMLAAYVRTAKQPLFREGTLFGYETRLGRSASDGILRDRAAQERIRPQDFRFSDLQLACSGGKRKLFIRPSVSFENGKDRIVLKFFLPKGSYASVVLNELCKKNPFPVSRVKG